MKTWNFLLIAVFILFVSCAPDISKRLQKQVLRDIKKPTIHRADSFLVLNPVTITDFTCSRSAGGRHDFFSEADYFWPDPKNPVGPYIQKDGESNPDIFSQHRHAMIRLSEIAATLTSAWLLTGKQKYADKAMVHLNAWFIDTSTMMNPNMLYAQAIYGKNTGRGIGLIDAYHLVEVVQSIKVLSEKGGISKEETDKLKEWFSRFLTWMTTHQYGIDEMNTKNNHGTCWTATASVMAKFTGNQEIIDLCMNRFKTILLPNQMANDGSFPLEIKRTKPYGYSLFNIDAMCNVAEILSGPGENLWNYATPDGKSISNGMGFIFPYIIDKTKWPYQKDIYIWDEWPVRQSSLLFAGIALKKKIYINQYLKLQAYPDNQEVIRNLPVRHPAIWLPVCFKQKSK